MYYILVLSSEQAPNRIRSSLMVHEYPMLGLSHKQTVPKSVYKQREALVYMYFCCFQTTIYNRPGSMWDGLATPSVALVHVSSNLTEWEALYDSQ